ncbi:sensor histidine kinase [Cohnella sp.]|uniref:cache domain-containing sensor histidine kinase n=1 Tax=Cohnella sp. TaxID=1883426 RepID=UPI003561EA8A
MVRKLRALFSFRSIRYKLMIASVACILVPAAISLLIYNSLTQEAVKKQAMSNAEDSLLLVNGSVTFLLNSMLNIANSIQLNADLSAYFKLINAGNEDKTDPYREFSDKRRVIEQLDAMAIVGEKINVTVLLANDAYFTNYSTEEYHPLAIKNEVWFEKLKEYKGYETLWIGTTPTSFQLDKLENPYQISIARTLRVGESGSIYGYIVVTIMENKINKIFDQLSEGKEVLLVDENDRILSSARSEQIGQPFIHARPLEGKTGSYIAPINESKYLITEQALSVNNWRLVSMQPYQAAIVDISSIFSRVFTVQIISFVVFLLLLLVLLRAFTKPLIRLSKTTSAVQRGNLNIRTGVRGQDEVGRLGFLFDQMLDRVQEMIAEVSDTQARKRKAELKMLQAQIHPHFLFNVLNSIRMKVMRRGDRESANMIGSLSKLLRMTISRDKDEIHLHEELELITYYVELMNLRQKEEVKLSLDIAPDAFHVPVPRFFLQPIVENALIHGLSQKAGIIRIEAEITEGRLTLKVEDNGVGMDEAKQEALKRKLQGAESPSEIAVEENGQSGFSGFGLLNVVERMKMISGDDFQLEVRSARGEGTVVCLTIRCQEEQTDV